MLATHRPVESCALKREDTLEGEHAAVTGHEPIRKRKMRAGRGSDADNWCGQRLATQPLADRPIGIDRAGGSYGECIPIVDHEETDERLWAGGTLRIDRRLQAGRLGCICWARYRYTAAECDYCQ